MSKHGIRVAAISLLVCLCECLGGKSSGSADDLDNIIFEGSVKDVAGAVIVGATVTVLNTKLAIKRSTLCDSTGRYRIVTHEPGAFAISVAATGFREEHVELDQVVTGRRISIDFQLSPVGTNEEVTIQASTAPLIDTSRMVTGDTLSRSELDTLPLISRDPLSLVFLLGGAAEAPLSTMELAEEGAGVFLRGTPEEAGIFSLTGAPATSNNITIDGLDNNDDRSARERISLNPEAVAEVQVITNQYAAEYGRAAGSRVNIRTRGGENRYRGEMYGFFGDESLNANTFFRNARGLGRVPHQQIRAGLSFGGPLIKEKQFFFASYERRNVPDYAEIRVNLPVEVNPLFKLPRPNHPVATGAQVGLLSEELSTPETNNLFNLRGDFNFSQLHNLSARFDIVRGGNKRGFPGGSRLPETILIGGRDSDSISLSDNVVISPRLLNQARVQISRLLPRSRGSSRSVGVVIEEPDRIVAGAFTGSESSPAFAREEKRIQFQESLSVRLGAHQLKVGGDLQLVRSTFEDLFATGGQFTFEAVDDFLANRFSRFVQRFDTESSQSNDVVGLFFQDEWKMRPNLTLSLGLRWDSESIVNDRDNLSPRLAIAWDPFGGANNDGAGRGFLRPGRTVVRAGFGLFFNRALLRTLDDFSLGRSRITVDSELTPGVLSFVRFPEPISDRELVKRFGVQETEFLRRTSADLEIPYTVQSGLGIERQLGRGFVVAADYIFTRGVHLWREANINAPVLPKQFSSFTEYLLSRDFDNRRGANGSRPVTGSNADVVRFDLGQNTSASPGALSIRDGVRLLTLGLNAPRSSNIAAALNAIRHLRPDPTLTQVELLESTGNSFYHGAMFSLRGRLGNIGQFRAVYTLSKFIDEGTTNTASPQDLHDRRAERALSLQDQRHRFTLSGAFQLPRVGIDLGPVISVGSSKPFNIGDGFDRNLNDIQNDRPNFVSEIGRPEWRRPGSAEAVEVKEGLALAPIGSSGNLPRNYGRGPGTFTFNLRASRTVRLGERISIRPAIDAFNVLNTTVFSFGSEFIDRDDADFLFPRRTQRARVIHLSMKLSF